ncbi:MAG: hypothetical protein MZV64_31160 [Ignavibacteriales bacterium]|nr:hypothetical protein [Ignavibacteriales bacterium]
MEQNLRVFPEVNIINDATLQVKDAAGTAYQLNVDYELNFEKGAIKKTDNSALIEGTEYFYHL